MSKKVTGRRSLKMNVQGTTVGKVASRAARKAVKSLAELKHIDYTIFNDPVQTTATLYNLVDNLVQGDGDTQVNGRKADLRRLYMKYSLTVGDSSNICRFILFQSTQYTNSVPTAAQVLENPVSFPLTTALNYDSFNGSVRFRLIKDWYHVRDSDDPVLARSLEFNKLNNIIFDGNPVAAGNAAKGNLWLLAISDSSGGFHPTLNMYTRVTFKEL